MKTCCQCKKVLDQSDFYKDSRKKDGLRSNCKRCQNIKVEQHTLKNKESILDKQRKYYHENRLQILAKKKKDNLNRSAKALEYYHNVRKNSYAYKINAAITSGIYKSLKQMKNGKAWEKLTGYTLEQLIDRIDSLLKPGMSFENYGKVWHIDHIKPKSKCESFEEAWSINNLQPLFKEDNLKKGNKYNT